MSDVPATLVVEPMNLAEHALTVRRVMRRQPRRFVVADPELEYEQTASSSQR